MDPQVFVVKVLSYGFLIRTIVEGILALKRVDNEKVIKAIVFAVSAIFVFVLGVKPSMMLGVDFENMSRVVDATLLAGAAMGTHDILDLIAKKKGGML